ncbi:MAG: hypothetical protein O7G87_24395 [bacterium]|nr:hypothetical protein [bacterium]
MLNRMLHTMKVAVALMTLAAMVILTGCGTAPMAPDLEAKDIDALALENTGVEKTNKPLTVTSGSEDGIGDTDEADGPGEDTGLSDEDLYQDPDFGDNDSEAPLGQIR